MRTGIICSSENLLIGLQLGPPIALLVLVKVRLLLLLSCPWWLLTVWEKHLDGIVAVLCFFLMWHCTFYFCNFSYKFLQILLCKLRFLLDRNKRGEMFLN